MIKNIFNQVFIAQAQEILQSNCAGQKTLFKKDFAKLLGFSLDSPKSLLVGLNLVSLMFEMGHFPEYKILPGKYGGIIHIPSFQKSSSNSFPKGFLQDLYNVLCENCNAEPISRNEIAKKLNYNLTEEQICNFITISLQKNYITGFKGKPGKNGGIIKISNTEPKLTVENPQSSLDFLHDAAIVELPPASFWTAISQPAPEDECLAEAQSEAI